MYHLKRNWIEPIMGTVTSFSSCRITLSSAKLTNQKVLENHYIDYNTINNCKIMDFFLSTHTFSLFFIPNAGVSRKDTLLQPLHVGSHPIKGTQTLKNDHTKH